MSCFVPFSNAQNAFKQCWNILFLRQQQHFYAPLYPIDMIYLQFECNNMNATSAQHYIQHLPFVNRLGQTIKHFSWCNLLISKVQFQKKFQLFLRSQRSLGQHFIESKNIYHARKWKLDDKYILTSATLKVASKPQRPWNRPRGQIRKKALRKMNYSLAYLSIKISNFWLYFPVASEDA